MKILLINPPFQRLNRVCNPYFPLGLGYIASVLVEAGHVASIYNVDKGKEEKDFHAVSFNEARISSHENYIEAINNPRHYVWTEIVETLQAYKPDVVGIQAMSSTFPSTALVAKLCKEYDNNVPVVVGGIHATIQPKQVISDPNIDFVVYGEGEMTMLDLVNCLEKKGRDFDRIDGIYYKKDGEVCSTQKRAFIADLDQIPFPGRELSLNRELYGRTEFGSLISSRGCPFDCTFCNAQSLWTRKVRSRSPENIVSEIELLKRDYGVKLFSFQDDTLTFNKKFLLTLCNLLIERELNIHWTSFSRAEAINRDNVSILKESGCVRLTIGVESGSERMLKIMNKNNNLQNVLEARRLLEENGIKFSCCLLIGTPDETVDDLKKTIQFIKELKPNSANVCTYTPYPGSKMYDRVVELGLLEPDMDWLQLSHHSSYNNFAKNISQEDFGRLRSELVTLADTLTNRLDTTFLKDKVRLLLNNPSYFFKRVPYYIKNLPRHIKNSFPQD